MKSFLMIFLARGGVYNINYILIEKREMKMICDVVPPRCIWISLHPLQKVCFIKHWFFSTVNILWHFWRNFWHGLNGNKCQSFILISTKVFYIFLNYRQIMRCQCQEIWIIGTSIILSYSVVSLNMRNAVYIV